MTTKSPSALTRAELAELLLETGHHHHQAYIEADGVDPEWALWYAAYLHSRIWDRAGSLPPRSRLVYLLLHAESEHAEAGGDAPWPEFYADIMLRALTAN